ncbi:MAG TPA: DUF4328 domain-containing protein [Polyangia bacterium]
MEAFVSARGRSIAITVLVILQLVTMSLSMLAWYVGASQLGDNNMTAAMAAFGSAAAAGTINSLLFLAATVVFLTWVHRAIANLPALGSMSCRFSPSGAVWSYFIPFVNLVRGHQVMATIWQESQPPAVNEHGFYLPRSATIVHWWWGLYLFNGLAGVFTAMSRPFGVDDLRSFASTQVFLQLPHLAAGILFLLMIRRAQARQDEQWQDLERRRNVPQPSAAALR